MGSLRFTVPNRHCLHAEDIERIYMCGMEETPWISRAAWDSDLLAIDRAPTPFGGQQAILDRYAVRDVRA